MVQQYDLDLRKMVKKQYKPRQTQPWLYPVLTIYPVGGLFIIEILSRIISKTGKPVPSWLKLSIQGVTMVGFAVAYTVFLPFFVNQDHTAEPHTITAFCLLALAVALFYQARRAKINPEKSLY